MITYLIWFQNFWKKVTRKPFGPGAVLAFISIITWPTSSADNGRARSTFSVAKTKASACQEVQGQCNPEPGFHREDLLIEGINVGRDVPSLLHEVIVCTHIHDGAHPPSLRSRLFWRHHSKANSKGFTATRITPRP